METKTVRILFVDDDKRICESCSEIFEEQGYQVDIALTAEKALKKSEKANYNVVVTDLMMPGLSGMDLLRIVHERGLDVPVIMITGYATVKTAVESMKLGAFDYLPKPFEPEQLIGVVSRALKRQELAEIVEETDKKAVSGKKEEGVGVIDKKALHPMHLMWEEGAMPSERVKRKPQPCPVGYYCISEHSWVKINDDGTVLIGIDDTFLKTLGEILYIDLPKVDDELEQGRVFVRIICHRGMLTHMVWSPVSGKVIEVNSIVETNPALVTENPYGRGWIAKIEPSNIEDDISNLVKIPKKHDVNSPEKT